MKALVTGGGGFLGSAIVKALLDRGDSVKTIQRGDYPILREWGAETIQGDVSKPEDINAAVKDCDVVFHVAAKAGVWGDYDEYYQANVLATKNVLDACRINNVKNIVYTSTPSVVFDGSDENGINEATPYTKIFFNAYQKTKAQAEQLVLAASNHVLQTVALRPHLIWGPGDTNLVPRVISRAKAGRLRLVSNTGKKVDSCYIDNAVEAHLLAADCLLSNGLCAGKAYFISNDEPMQMSELINRILASVNIPPVTRTIPESMAYVAGVLFEKFYSLFNIQQEPIMTRFVAKQLSTSHWFDLSAAKQDLGYQALVSIEEGMKRLKTSLSLVSNQ